MGFIPVGRVVSAHGVRGGVRFRYYNESESNLCGYGALFAENDGQKLALKPWRVQPRSGYFIIQFEGRETVESVSFLVGKELFVREEDLPVLGEGEFYDYQLVGLNAVNEQNESVGRVTDVVHTKANDILVVSGDRELLIPMHEEFILDIDMEKAVVTIAERAFIE